MCPPAASDGIESRTATPAKTEWAESERLRPFSLSLSQGREKEKCRKMRLSSHQTKTDSPNFRLHLSLCLGVLISVPRMQFPWRLLAHPSLSGMAPTGCPKQNNIYDLALFP
jgi:hypothetical protein